MSSINFARYWHRTDKPITQAFVDEVLDIFDECKHVGISLGNSLGVGSPVANLDIITFNGNTLEDKRLAGETFRIINDDEGKDSCGTGHRPYEYAVTRVLEVAKKHGLVENIYSDSASEPVAISDEKWLKMRYHEYF